MNANPDTPRKNSLIIRFVLVGFLLLLVVSCTIVYLEFLIRVDWSVRNQRSYAVTNALIVSFLHLALRLPQFLIALLLVSAIAYLVIVVRKRQLGSWKVYLPLGISVLLAVFLALSIPVWARSSVRARLEDDSNGADTMRAIAERVLGGWPTPPHCAISEEVAVLVHYWSFRAVDGRMPVLVWSKNGMPSSELSTSPVSCEHLDDEWFFCYLLEPEELVYDYSGLCYLEE